MRNFNNLKYDMLRIINLFTGNDRDVINVVPYRKVQGIASLDERGTRLSSPFISH